MRVGLLYPTADPLSPANWSGIPAGLASGMVAHGADVVPIGTAMPPALRGAVAALSRSTGRRGEVAERMAVARWVRTRALAARFAAAGPLDAVVAMGNEMHDLPRALASLGPSVPLATFDDATMAQQIRDPWSDVSLAKIPARLFDRAMACQRAANRAAAVCCVSTRWAATSCEADFGVPPERIAVVGMGHRPRWSAACGDRDWSAPKYLFVGAEWQRKNGDAVLAAFAAVRREFPTATLDVVGDHPRIDQHGVTTHGFLARDDAAAQSRLDRLYAEATCFVLPSRYDAAGIAYLEAASAGLAVIATTRGGAPEMVGDGAVTVDPFDSSALPVAMRALADPATARARGAEALRRAELCSWEAVAGRVLGALHDAPATPSRSVEHTRSR
ncbi:glycosyltransferase family 4 protein [Micromonospora sp. NPDC048999]|uniref:glycosyltransferase family 4 protein n=1 Tax=Micromonospora sp. NPDC048999 TaxID=3155391 RepID=UPI0033FE714B